MREIKYKRERVRVGETKIRRKNVNDRNKI